ncbi:MAG: M24 family metallopeptidase [Chloroflexota bacterium]
MKKDLDALMKQAGIDVLLVSGSATHNPAMTYFTGNVHVHYGVLILKRGFTPVLFCNPMEREEAARTGFETRNLAEYKLNEILKEVDGDPARAAAVRFKRMLADVGVTSGKMSICGLLDAGHTFAVFNALQELAPEIEIIGEIELPVLLQARETKDLDEVEHTRQMGAITVEIVGRTAKFLQSHKAKEGVLVKEDGSALTIGEVKRKINLWAAELGVENPHGTIFAIGRDAGIPHSAGADDDKLELGKTIVFDIFLQQTGGGYHFDFTRTWCLGYAPEKEQKLYDDVRSVYDQIISEMVVDMPFPEMQARTCELFEGLGHATKRQDPLLLAGYVHGIGHGIGLDLHELPFSRYPKATLKPGVIVTIEPGLYYPDEGMGCRLEDAVYVSEDGRMELLAEYPYDLVLPIEEV